MIQCKTIYVKVGKYDVHDVCKPDLIWRGLGYIYTDFWMDIENWKKKGQLVDKLTFLSQKFLRWREEEE